MAGRLTDMNLPRFPLLSNEEVQALLVQAKAGDEAARERIINCNLRLVFNLIQRFANRDCEMEDLFQIGVIGLMKAIDKFDSSYGVRFSTYAVPMIIGEIRRFLRDDGPIKISRSLKETGIRIRYTQEQLTKELGREPKLSEVAEKLELTPEQLTEALEATQYLTSIHEELYQDDGDAIYVIDQLADREDDGKFLEHIALEEVQLSAIGCPIKGDLKYGDKRSNPDGSISLMSHRIEFTHPVSGNKIDVTAPVPDDNLWRALDESIKKEG